MCELGRYVLRSSPASFVASFTLRWGEIARFLLSYNQIIHSNGVELFIAPSRAGSISISRPHSLYEDVDGAKLQRRASSSSSRGSGSRLIATMNEIDDVATGSDQLLVQLSFIERRRRRRCWAR